MSAGAQAWLPTRNVNGMISATLAGAMVKDVRTRKTMVKAALTPTPAIRTNAGGLSVGVRQNAALQISVICLIAGARASATAASATGATSAILCTAVDGNAKTTAAAVNDAVVIADGEQGDGGN